MTFTSLHLTPCTQIAALTGIHLVCITTAVGMSLAKFLSVGSQRLEARYMKAFLFLAVIENNGSDAFPGRSWPASHWGLMAQFPWQQPQLVFLNTKVRIWVSVFVQVIFILEGVYESTYR